MNTFLKISAIAAMAALLSGCNNDTQPSPDGPGGCEFYPQELVFEALSAEEALVTVAASDPDWTPSVTVSWLNVEKESASTLRVSASDVVNKEDRMAEITLTSSDGKSQYKLPVKQWGLNTVTTLTFRNGETEAPLAPVNRDARISFLPDPLLPRTLWIDVTKASSFTCEGETAESKQWLTVKRDADRMTFTVAKYDQTIDRSVDLKFITGVSDERKIVTLTVTQKGSGPHFETMLSGGIPAKNISGNGRYMVGSKTGASWILDRANETFYRVGSGGGAVDETNPDKGTIILSAISNDGVASGTAVRTGSGASVPVLFDVKTKTFTWLDMNIVSEENPEGKPGSGAAWDISADGRTVVGYILIPPTKEEKGGTLEAVLNVQVRYYPVMWRDGVLTRLGVISEGFKTDKHHGYVANLVCSDGKRAAGYLEDRFSNRIACTWDLTDPTARPEMILWDNADYFGLRKQTFHYGESTDQSTWKTVDIDLPYLFVTAQDISSDGTFISLTRAEAAEGGATSTHTPLAYNAVTKQVVFRSKDNDSLGGFFMPDGTMSLLTPSGNTNARQTYFCNGTTQMIMSDYMRENHALQTPVYDAAGFPTYFTMLGISDDGKVMAGFNTGVTGFVTAIVSL